MNEIEDSIVLEKFVESISTSQKFESIKISAKYEIVRSPDTATYFSRRKFHTHIHIHSTTNSQKCADHTHTALNFEKIRRRNINSALGQLQYSKTPLSPGSIYGWK
jgi:hypothetical protein